MYKKIGCLIIHGFAGNINEIEPLNRYLLNSGFITLCPSLKGHTGIKKDLSESNYTEWIKSAEEGFLMLQSRCDEIILIGFSMGGLIAINLSQKYKVAGLITLSTPIYYWDLKLVVENILHDYKSRTFNNLKFYIAAAFKIPISAMINFRILLSKTKPLIKKVNCPAFITQGLMDDTVNYKSAAYIYTSISSKVKQNKYYKNSNHIICCGNDNAELFKDIILFINSCIICTCSN